MQEPPPSAVRKFAPHPKSFAAVGSVLPDAPIFTADKHSPIFRPSAIIRLLHRGASRTMLPTAANNEPKKGETAFVVSPFVFCY